MDDLVKRLSEGSHDVEFESRTKSLEEIKSRIDDGFVFITFTKTRGGTELGINIEKDLIDISKADFNSGKGKIKIAGTCELNYNKVRCVADIDLSSKKGKGHLVVLNQ